MRFLFVCGGTAGHINPALGIAMELRRRLPNAKMLFVGAGKEMEKRLIPNAGFHLVNIRMSGIKRGISPGDFIHNVRTFNHLTSANLKSAKLLKRFKPDAVIGTGGYICYPVMKKAAQMGIPTFVHESNAVPGLTTKLLSANVDNVLIAFPGLEKLYMRPERVVITGTPVRHGFVTSGGKVEKSSGRSKPLVVSFWGSLGAEKMNEIITGFIKLNIESGMFDHIHAVGKSGGVELMEKQLSQAGASDELPAGIQIREYITDMHCTMAAADIIICRAGGSTIAELTIMGKPAILIPSPYVTNNQQVENAKQVEKSGGAIMLEEMNCSGKILYETVSSLLGDNEKLKEMSEAQKSLGIPNAAERIADLVLERCMSQ